VNKKKQKNFEPIMPVTRRQMLATLLLPTVTGKPLTPALKAIATQLDAIPPGPALLASYPSADAPPALRNAAFTYDNALALIALATAGHYGHAKRIGEAFLIALDHDRFWHDGRLRNAYRAGPMTTPAALPGYWNPQARLWSEDAYQVGSASGNVAWAALALFRLAPRDPRFGAGARRLVAWLAGPAWDHGVIGGFFGEESNPIRQNWHSTEQNIDAAVAMRAARDPKAATCRAFVASQFDLVHGCFNIGSGGGPTALDANLWPLLAFPDASPEWHRALVWVRERFETEGGLGYRENPDGIWTEGTAQGALTFALAGDQVTAKKLFLALNDMTGPGGYLYAARHEIRTGLAVGPTSTTDDFRYYRLPHLGATAWAALAFSNANPFLSSTNWS